LNTETGAISPDRGNHAIRVTRSGQECPGGPRRVRYSVRHLAFPWTGRLVRRIALLNVERLGMRREGGLRQSTWATGKWADDLLYGLLHEEWQTGPG